MNDNSVFTSPITSEDGVIDALVIYTGSKLSVVNVYDPDSTSASSVRVYLFTEISNG